MTNTWTKIAGDWAVLCPTQQAPGAVVTVTNRSGVSKTVTLGANIQTNAYGFAYAVAQAAPRTEAQVGKVDGILALFDRTAKRLKFPAIELSIPQTDTVVRVSIAGPRAKVPGSLTITGERQGVGEDATRPWYGRVLRDGTFQPAREAPAGLAERLAQFAAEPAKLASEYGKLTGRCCFCRLPLGGDSPDSPTGRKSLAVGYGQTCARNWGLPWGEERQTFAA